jgi:pimeloyl-ACP methyl ester carboxylesterase
VPTTTLRDGRTLRYETFGDPDGHPVIHCHGWGDSRLTRHPDDELTARTRTRLITVDRPGVGRSSPQRGRTMASWAHDVAALADHLELESFSVSGHSGGGPHALAVAAGLGDRVVSVAVICGWAPVDRPGGLDGVRKDVRSLIAIGRRAPWSVRFLLGSAPRQYRKNPERAFAKQFANGMPPCDRAVLDDDVIHANILAGACESVRPGVTGLVQEALLLFAQPWDIDWSAVAAPVELWYGADDTLTPPHMGTWLAEHLPAAHLRVVPHQGHLVLWSQWEEILRSLSAPSPP